MLVGLMLLFVFGAFSVSAPTTLEQIGEKDSQGDSSVTEARSMLDLSSQNLTKVPNEVFNNSRLESLDLSHNQLTGALPAEVRHLSSLKILKLNDNLFTGVPAEVGQLQNLEILDLSNNQLTGLPHELGNLLKLKQLNVSGNAYSEQDLSVIRSSLPSTTIINL